MENRIGKWFLGYFLTAIIFSAPLISFATPNEDAQPVFLGIAKDAAGKVKTMTQADAIQYCASQGNHLPSARELVQLMVSMGAKGIVNACGIGDHCDHLDAINVDGSQDSFNVSYAGFNPTDPEMNNMFWSSSVETSDSITEGLVLNGDQGGGVGGLVDLNPHSRWVAVRCVSGR